MLFSNMLVITKVKHKRQILRMHQILRKVATAYSVLHIFINLVTINIR